MDTVSLAVCVCVCVCFHILYLTLGHALNVLEVKLLEVKTKRKENPLLAAPCNRGGDGGQGVGVLVLCGSCHAGKNPNPAAADGSPKRSTRVEANFESSSPFEHPHPPEVQA